MERQPKKKVRWDPDSGLMKVDCPITVYSVYMCIILRHELEVSDCW